MCAGCQAKERLNEAQQVVADVLAAWIALEAGHVEEALRMTGWLIDPHMVEGAV